MMLIYGIKNCDTVKKTLRWLDDAGFSYTFHDYKSKGVSAEKLHDWCQQVGWESLLNKKGTTWRKLAPEAQQVSDEASAVALMLQQNSVIKRPLIEVDGKVKALGFDEATLSNL